MWACNYCAKRFDTEHGLKTHIARMHKAAPDGAEPIKAKKVKKRNNKYGKKEHKEHTDPPVSKTAEVRFCPRCGTDMTKVVEALNK